MPKLKIKDKEFELEKGKSIKDSCEKAGIPFGCEDGNCGTCMIEVREGQNLLCEINDKERSLGIDDKSLRLACQCTIKNDKNIKDDEVIEIEGYV